MYGDHGRCLDAVLLSHDHHPDNLDRAGRELLHRVGVTYSTSDAAQRLGAPVIGLQPWDSVDIARPNGEGSLQVTAVPARHGPAGCEPLVGDVVGFVLSGFDLPTVYVSGVNAGLDLLAAIAARYAPVDVAVLHGGAARTALLGEADLTLDADGMVEATRLLGARVVVPVHVDGWAHFRQDLADVRASFHRAGLLDRLQVASWDSPVIV